ncbi:DUF4435 domain-containing protein [Lactococcus cremoris]|uniref:DUF4435 domain-containing protein n=1 Tax=Lactococcus lactis subsp. cremoris TaxID=1359 RepID=UPI0003AB5ECF|nr:DUF4435 domain-containing protein [Lactococcus cremoris]AGV73437.1 hypothetical protein kw2_1479 [Lactococcus cremoris subsp. cremoris KW2]
MSSNSVFDAVTSDSIANEIIMTLNAKPKTPIIVVEGIDDINLLKTVKSEQTIILESSTGKSGVFEIIEKCERVINRNVIGICDRDFDVQKNSEQENIFYYDYSCLEMMVFSNDGVYKKVLEQIDVDVDENSRCKVLHRFESITILRKCNFENGSGLNFKGVTLSKLISSEERKIILDELIKMIDSCTPKVDFNKKEKIYMKARLEAREDRTEGELLNLTQGHDFIEILRDLNNKSTRKKVSEDTIRRIMNSAYTLSAFMKTKLHSSITDYSTLSFFRDKELG